MTWQTQKLSEIVSFKTGKLDSNAAVSGGKYPFFTCSQETYRTDTFSFDTECVLLGGNNANGIFPLKYFSGKFDAYQRTYVITSKDSEILNHRFLYYALRPKLEHLRTMSTGATTKFLTLTILNSIEIDTPSIKTQRKIASILSAYDDLIENNIRRIAVLEETARCIYEEWFNRFRFPGHEKTQIVESELGRIPKNWRIGVLEDLVKNVRNSAKAGEHLNQRKYVPIECIAKKSLALSEYFSWEQAQSSLVLFEENDFLFGAMRPYFHKVAIAPFAGITRTTCFVLRAKESNFWAFAGLTLFAESTVEFATQNSSGATIPYAIWDGGLAKMKVIIPNNELLDKFQKIVSPILYRIRTMMFQQDNLRKTRDLLLRKLIAGEVDVSHFPAIENV